MSRSRIYISWTGLATPPLLVGVLYGLGAAITAHLGLWDGHVLHAIAIKAASAAGLAALRYIGRHDGRPDR